MYKIILFITALVFAVASISCKSFMPSKSADTGKYPAIDFTTPGKALDVKVELDKKQTTTTKVLKTGGTVSLNAADGSKFTLEVPAGALEADTEITMTAVKSIDGAPLDKNTPLAVQLEPSGLFFKEMATLTIVPAREIPVNDQIVFGYTGEGKDYHLAVVDHKSRDIKLKIMHFSGAGVGSGSDSAWASNLQIQAETSRTRLEQKMAAYALAERQRQLLGDESGEGDFFKNMKSLLEQYEDQVVLKERAAGELDCQFAGKAIEDIILVERQRQLLGFEPAPNIWEKVEKLAKIGAECKKAYRISGESNKVTFTGEICGLDKPFVVNGTYPGGTSKTSFSPRSVVVGSTTVTGGGSGCDHSGGGDYTISLNEDKSGTLTWTTSDRIVCPMFSNSRTATFTLPLQPAPDLACP